MSIIALTIAPLLEDDDGDWDVWYYGLIPLAAMQRDRHDGRRG